MLEDETGELERTIERAINPMIPFVTIHTERGPVEFCLHRDEKYKTFITLHARDAITHQEIFLPDQHKVSHSPRFRRRKRTATPIGEYTFFMDDIRTWFEQATDFGKLSILGPSDNRYQPAESTSKPVIEQTDNQDVTSAIELNPEDYDWLTIKQPTATTIKLPNNQPISPMSDYQDDPTDAS